MNPNTPSHDEMRLRSVIENSLDGIVAVDRLARICLVNKACAGLFGFSPEELLGQDMDMLLPEALRAHHRAVFESYCQTREGRTVMNRTVEFEAVDRYGAPLPIEISLADASFNGEFMVLANIRDLRPRRRSEDELKRFAALVEQSSEDVIVTDAKGLIRYVNPAFSKVTGYSAEEALGQNPRFLKSGRHDLEFYKAFWATLRSGKSWSGRVINRRKDGTLVEEDAIISPILDSDGQITGFAAQKRDVSDQVRLLEQTQKAQKMEAMERLAGNMAHDFNNLLTGISGYLDMARLISKDLGQERLLALLNDSKLGATRAAQLARQLLSFSRKQHLDPHPIDLNLLLGNLRAQLQDSLGDEFTLEFEFCREPLHVKLDVGHFEQALFNLLNNAREAMPDGGTIRFHLRALAIERNEPIVYNVPPGNYALLSVEDEGIGMTPEVMQHLFEPFFTTKPKGRGTGLGLATAFGTVSQHHGTIIAQSEPGKGSVFSVILPLTSAEQIECLAPAPAARANKPQSGNGECVLLVEDDAIVRDIAGRMLTQLGYHVLSACSADRALVLAEQEEGRVRLLFSDVVMPGMNGHELARVLSGKYPELKILLTSGYTNDVAFRDSPISPGFAFLHKPYNLQTLAAKIHELLAN